MKHWRERRKTSDGLRPLLTEPEVAEILGIPAQTLRNARATGVGGLAALPWLKVGRCVRYRPEVVERFLADSERGHAG
jgi:hypothetical protein